MIESILLERLYIVPHDHLEGRLPNIDPDTPLSVRNIIRRANGQQIKRGGSE